MINRIAAKGRDLSLSIVLLATSFISQSFALEFSVHPNAASMPAVTAVLAEGDVEDGDVERLSAFLSTAVIRKTIAMEQKAKSQADLEILRAIRDYRQMTSSPTSTEPPSIG